MERQNKTPIRSNEKGERWDEAPVRRFDVSVRWIWGGGEKITNYKIQITNKIQNTNYKLQTMDLSKKGQLSNRNIQNYQVKGSHGLHQGSFKLQTMTALIKSFCRGVQGGQFFQKAPPLAPEA